MGRQWGSAMKAAEQVGCVVSAYRLGQPEAGSWSCSGVILSRSPDLVLCHGGIFTPFLRAGSGLLTAAGATFLPRDSCADDLQLQVQWGPMADGPYVRAERVRPRLCTPQCAGPEPAPQARPRGRSPQPSRPAVLLLLLSCPTFRAHFASLFRGEAADQWHFASSASDNEVSEEEEEDQLRALGWFALLRVGPSPEEEGEEVEEGEEEEGRPTVFVAPLGAVPKGAPLLACGSPFGAFCPDIFLNTLSRGVLSNATGPLMLTDARCLPGTEGGGVFAARPPGALVALVVAPLCWKAREWVGLTLLCAAAPLLHTARVVLGRLDPAAAAALVRVLPPEVGIALGLPLRDPAPPYAASAVLVECGTVWGSGVALTPRLVLTCRHVAPREETRVLVHSTTPKSIQVWGRVLFATQEMCPYDIAVVRLEEDLGGFPMPVPTEDFHEGETVSVVGFGVFGQACGPSVTSGILSAVVEVDDTPVMLQTTCAVHGGSSGGPLFSTCSGDLLGIVASNTRDNNTGATYPHLNFSIPITVLQPALQQYNLTGDLSGFRELDHVADPVKVVWRLQRPLAETPRSKL